MSGVALMASMGNRGIYGGGGGGNNGCSHEGHRRCSLCKQGGVYRVQQQNLLHIHFDRLDRLLKEESNPVPAAWTQPPSGRDEPPRESPVSRTTAVVSPGSYVLGNQLRVVQEYRADLNSAGPMSDRAERRKNAAKQPRSKRMPGALSIMNSKQSSVEIESARATFHQRNPVHNSSIFKGTPLVHQSWEPPKRIVYAKHEFSINEVDGTSKYSRLARSPEPRRLSAKLVQIDINTMPANAPGHQLKVKFGESSNSSSTTASTVHQPVAVNNTGHGGYIPACYLAKNHDTTPHNPYVNYFKLKQLVSEGKLKLKNVPSFEWARIFQPPTSTVMAGDGDNNNTAGDSPESANLELPVMPKGELVNNWVRKSEMQPVTKYTRLEFEGGAGHVIPEQPQILPSTPTNAPQSRLSNYNAFSPQGSAYLKTRQSQRSKQALDAEDL